MIMIEVKKKKIDLLFCFVFKLKLVMNSKLKSLKIYTRNELRSLKEKKQQEMINTAIDRFIAMAHAGIINHAENSDNNTFNKSVTEFYSGCSDDFIRENKQSIIKRLTEYFPDVCIQIKTFGRLNNTMVDIDGLEESLKSLINTKFNQTHIVIDWSEDK